MISDILKAYKETDMAATSPKYECKYCGNKFARETTLVNHVCERKRRYQQEKEKGVQFGLLAYHEFYKMTQNAKPRNYDDFVDSPYYTAFVKFGRYCVDLRCINFLSFASWLLKNNKKIDFWCSDRLYEDWLFQYLRTEDAQDALERGIKEITEYAEENPELKNGYKDYFRYGNSNRILHHIATGRISPWLIYNCNSGIDFLSTLTDDQVAMVIKWIDPDYWQSKFKDSKSDTSWAKEILTQAGL